MSTRLLQGGCLRRWVGAMAELFNHTLYTGASEMTQEQTRYGHIQPPERPTQFKELPGTEIHTESQARVSWHVPVQPNIHRMHRFLAGLLCDIRVH